MTLDDAAGGSTVTNLATLDYTTATTGTASTYTTNPASVDVVQQADVSIVKTMAPNPAAAGTTVSATLAVSNDGPNTATGVVVTDELPAGWNGVTATSTVGSCSVTGGTVRCELGAMADEATATITLTGSTDPGSSATTLTNVASVTTTAFDTDPANNVSGASITLNRQADVSVTKTPVTQTAVPGEQVNWTLTVSNGNASDAVNVRIDDALDVAGLANITGATIAGGTGGTCTAPVGRSVRCALATLPAGASATVSVTGVLASSLAAGTVVANTVRVASDTPDPTPGNNTATATVTTTAPQADVRVAKSGPAEVVPGTQLTYTVTATNYGPSDAAGVVITDPLPAGVTPVSAQPSRGTCAIAGQTVSCTGIGTLLSNGPGVAGGSVTVTIIGTVAPGVTGTLSNTASASASTPDPVEGNNSATATAPVNPTYDVAVSKTANRTTIPGEASTIPYVITVRNNGPSTARDVAVRDLVPLLLDLDGVTTSDPSITCDADQADVPQPPPDAAQGLVTCRIAEIAPGGVATITVTMSTDEPLAADPAITEIVERVAIASADDTDAGNNEATWTLTGQPFTDLSITKSGPETAYAGLLPAGSGLNPAYTIVVTNNRADTGGDDEDAVRPVIIDTLPQGVTLRGGPGAVTAQIGDTSVGVACTVSGQQVRCQLDDNLAAEASVTLTVPVQVAGGMEPGTTLVNSVYVETGDMAANPDNNLSNNTAQASTTVRSLTDPFVAGLSITPVGSYTGPGSTWTFSFRVGNLGPSTAHDAVLRLSVDVLDGWVDLANLDDLPPGCDVVNAELVCPLGDLPATPTTVGYSFDFTVTGYADPGTYMGFAQISTTSTEGDYPGKPVVGQYLANNRVEAPFTVGPPVTDLAVTKVALNTTPNPNEPALQHPSFVAGGPFSYQIAVQVPRQSPDEVTAGNTGLADAEGVVVTDELPVGFVPSQATAPGGSCTITAPTDPAAEGYTVSCPLGTVAGFAGSTPAQPAIMTVHGLLDPDANNLHGGDVFAEQVPNTAVATTDTPLLGGVTSVSDTVAVDIVEIADLQLTKTPSSDVVYAGGSIGYTLTVVNAGPSGVEHAVITDVLPPGFALDAAASDCDPPLTAPVDETAASPQAPAPGPGQQRIACRVGAIPSGTSASLHIVATTGATMDPAAGTRNTATVGLLGNDVDEANNTATADVDLRRLTDLAISSALSTTTPAAGQEVTFTGFAVNNGPSTAVNTSGTTVFPRGFVPVSWDVPFNDCTWSRSTEPGVEVEPPPGPESVPFDGSFSWVLECVPQTPGAAWEPGGAATNVVVMYVPADTPAGTYTGESVIRSETPEERLDNNVTAQTLTVQHVSDTRITKTLVRPNPMQAGLPATWRLTVVNDGPSVADNVVIADTVPNGMTYVTATNEAGAICPAPEIHDTETIVRCPMGSLEVGETASALVTFRIGDTAVGSTLCNAALVGSGSLDPDADDNQSRACGTAVRPPVPPATDVGVRVTAEQQRVRPGGTARFTVAVRNNGPRGATGVVVRIPVPAGLRNVSAPGCRMAAGTRTGPVARPGRVLVCPVGALTAGERTTFRVSGTVTRRAGDRVRLRATVGHAAADTNPANDTSQDSVPVRRRAGAPDGPPPDGPTPVWVGGPSVPSDGGGDGPSGGFLPDTGGPALAALLAGLAAVLLGLGLVAAGLRRRPDGEPSAG